MVVVEGLVSQNTGNPVNWDQYWIRSYYYSGLNSSGSYATSTKGWWGYNLAQTYGGGGDTENDGIFWYQSSPFTNYGLRTYILEVHQIDVRGIGAGRFDPANTFPNSYDRGFEWNDSTINTKWGIQTYYYRYAVLINQDH